MDENEIRVLTKKVSNAIWNEIREYAESGITFEWEVRFTERETRKEIEIGEG
jgi:hypothetical protein